MTLRVDAGQLEALIAETFERAGCMRDEAERIAMRLLGANLTGVERTATQNARI